MGEQKNNKRDKNNNNNNNNDNWHQSDQTGSLFGPSSWAAPKLPL